MSTDPSWDKIVQNQQPDSTSHQITKIAIVALVLASEQNPFQEGYTPPVPSNHMPSSKFAVYLWPVEAINLTLKTIPLSLLPLLVFDLLSNASIVTYIFRGIRPLIAPKIKK